MEWQEKDLLIIDEVNMLGAQTMFAVNKQLCRLRECDEDFGGIPIVLFCGDFHQFRPMQQRQHHDKAHLLWNKFTIVVMLKEQVRAAQDPALQRLQG